MSLFNRIFLARKIDAWANDYKIIAARTLNQVAADLIAYAEGEIANVGLKDGLFSQAAFVQDRVAPMVRKVAEPVAIEILEEANIALLELVEDQAVWVRRPEHCEGPEGLFDSAADIASAVVPLTAGVAAAATLPFAAFTTTTAWFGLVTTTAISWPVVLGGGAVAGLGLATGVINTAKIRDRTLVRLRNRVRRFILASLVQGSEHAPSILQQLGAEFDRAARRAKAL
ncbi:hypothetical protein [Novosphingobium sp. ST904]|uniref:hypothetical protein n=1 Tax=Novosphingobium sp. ST904 TaxID=1684385 RepID=UPI0006C840DF|nr:hypothetical protein [Novosphingobium sp. ST904]KPH67120.1 hypothetical protein ADT71_02820 [Novosphingobium sp. ST904]TCM25083.1 hypothetical protein EDF59_1472 [Novosphingobium sp. ST904]